MNRLLLVLLAILAIGAVTASFMADQPVRQAVLAGQGKGWKKSDGYRFHSVVRKVGDWPWLMLAGGVGFAIAWVLRSREWKRILVAAMIASTLAGIIANTSRLTTGRSRPRDVPKIAEGFYGPWYDGKTTIGNPSYNSFPSGHTATAFGFAGVILFASPVLGIGAMVLAGVIGWASIMIGAHHLSDVVVSIILSLVVAWFVWQRVKRHGDHDLKALRSWVACHIRRG